MSEIQRFQTLSEFYPYYLGEHQNQTCRRLHFVGTSLAIGLALTAITTSYWWLLGVALVEGYAFAWVGHFFFEHNKPATFKYPRYSYLSDFRMWWDMVTGKIPL